MSALNPLTAKNKLALAFFAGLTAVQIVFCLLVAAGSLKAFAGVVIGAATVVSCWSSWRTVLFIAEGRPRGE